MEPEGIFVTVHRVLQRARAGVNVCRPGKCHRSVAHVHRRSSPPQCLTGACKSTIHYSRDHLICKLIERLFNIILSLASVMIYQFAPAIGNCSERVQPVGRSRSSSVVTTWETTKEEEHMPEPLIPKHGGESPTNWKCGSMTRPLHSAPATSTAAAPHAAWYGVGRPSPASELRSVGLTSANRSAWAMDFHRSVLPQRTTPPTKKTPRNTPGR